MLPISPRVATDAIIDEQVLEGCTLESMGPGDRGCEVCLVTQRYVPILNFTVPAQTRRWHYHQIRRSSTQQLPGDASSFDRHRTADNGAAQYGYSGRSMYGPCLPPRSFQLTHLSLPSTQRAHPLTNPFGLRRAFACSRSLGRDATSLGVCSPRLLFVRH